MFKGMPVAIGYQLPAQSLSSGLCAEPLLMDERALSPFLGSQYTLIFGTPAKGKGLLLKTTN